MQNANLSPSQVFSKEKTWEGKNLKINVAHQNFFVRNFDELPKF